MAEEQEEPRQELQKKVAHYSDRSVEKYRDVFNALLKSKVIPVHIKNFETAYAITRFGRELGFSEVQSMHCITKIEGRMTLSAAGISALLSKADVKYRLIHDFDFVYADGTMSYFPLNKSEKGESIDRLTEIEAEYKGITHTFRFTHSDAVRQGLINKDNWKRMPRDMARARCISKMGRFLISDFLMGLYTVVEIVDAGLSRDESIVDVGYTEDDERNERDEEISNNDGIVTDIDSELIEDDEDDIPSM